MKVGVRILISKIHGPGIVSFSDRVVNERNVSAERRLYDSAGTSNNDERESAKVIRLIELTRKLRQRLNLLEGLPIPDFNNQYDLTIL